MKKLKVKVLNDYILYIVSLSLASITILSALVLAGTTPSAHADTSSTTTTSITVTESCSMTGATNTSHTAELYNGTYSGTDYSDGIGQTTIKAFCNDGMGFAIYAIGYTNDEYGNTKLHWSGASSSSDDTNAISTGIYESGTTTNSTWSMKLASVAGTYAPTVMDGTNDTENFTTWHVVPEEYTKVAYKTTGTDILVNDTGTGASVTVTYDAYISATQPAGTYIGQVKYTLVHPNTAPAPIPPIDPLDPSDCPANSICYAPNASDVEGTMISEVADTTTLSSISDKYPTAAKQTQTIDDSGSTANVTSNSTATLVAPNYKREGYGFAGWSTDFTATDSSTIYGPNETINTGDLSTNGLILYPVWVESTGNLQDFSCASSGLTQATYDTTNNKMVATLSSVTALTDSRDGNVYAVARLADDQCWMIENLRLGTDDSTDSSLAQGFGGTFAGLPATTDSWNFSNYTLAQLNTNNTNAAIMGGTGLNTSSASLVNTPGYPFNKSTAGQQGTTFSWYSYGNYYSWAAAIADTTAYNSANGHTTVETSICPSGWHLPYGAASSSYLGNTAGGLYYLNKQMSNNTPTQGSKDWRMFPNNFIYSGLWAVSSAYGRGGSAAYWSSSAYNGDSAFDLIIQSSNLGPGTNKSPKSYGHSVRCVAGS